MFNAKAALAALGCCAALVLSAHAAASDLLTLEDAFARTAQAHPELRRLPLRQAALSAEVELAEQAPPLVLGTTVENALGSGDYRGIDSAEFSLNLGSVLEPSELRAARGEVARSRLAGLDVEAEARRLDLMSEVARRYLDTLSLEQDADALETSVDQRRETATAAARRVRSGASPESVRLAAEAALARAELDLARTRDLARAARRRLSLLWGADVPDFDTVSGDLTVLPDTPSFETLLMKLERTPELERFAGESRLREARLQLARSGARPSWEWQLGVRRLQGSDDWALLGGVSLPLGNRRRAEPAIRAAQAELDELALEREAGALDLRATLAEAFGRLESDALAVHQSGERVLPLLEKAERSAGKAYRAGALSYLEWAQLQADLLDARRERIAAARDFHRALIEIQRLTAEPFVLADGTKKESTR